MRNEKMAANAGGMQTESDSGQFYTGRQDVAANDAGLPAVRGWGRYIQRRSKNESWEFVAAEDWSERQQQLQPLYASALEIDGEFSDDVPPLYRGDMYLDWDVGSPDEFGYCINDVNEFLDKLKTDYGVKLECLRIYATGGRGFHVEIPWSVYRADNWEKGALMLPQTYREMARQMHGRYMDLAIYSVKRGRMWRQPNVQRENGRYKVPITLDEMRRMTVEMYEEICNAPRLEPERAAPELAAALVALFDVCHSRVAGQEKKPARRLFKLVELPDTLAAVLAGKGLKSDVGFNQLALQLAIAAHALGWEIDDLLAQTAELCADWRGDSHTTAGHCADELRRMFDYTSDNSGYAYSPNAIRALLADTSETDDLAGEIDLDEVAKAKRPEVVAALAELDPLTFDACKKDVAAAMDVGATVLTDEVKRLRSKQAAAREREASEAEAARAKEGTVPIVAPNPEPWPTPVDGETLLTEAATFIRRYAYADARIIDAAALFVALTYAQDVARFLPIAHITAPEMRCGKSTLYDTLAEVVCRPLAVTSISSAAFVRVVNKCQPTLMFDEFDQMNKELKNDVTAMLNAGHKRGAAKVVKSEKIGDTYEPVAFDIFCPKVICGIGRITSTTADRSIRLQMARKMKGETVHSRYDDEEAHDAEVMCLRRKFCRWVADNAEKIRDARPKRIKGAHDRMFDNWHTMLAIAETAGGIWVERAQAAARYQIELAKADDGDENYRINLLRDIRDIFAGMNDDRYDGIAAADLVSLLCKDETKAWATFNNGKPLTAHRMNKILSGYGIKSDRSRQRGQVYKSASAGDKPSAYFVEDLEPVFERYLRDEGEDDGNS